MLVTAVVAVVVPVVSVVRRDLPHLGEFMVNSA
jgi:hypothetical protein